MMVPQVATMVPLFKMFSKAGLLNTAVGFILPIISTPFMIMMFRQNARSFPVDIIEADVYKRQSEKGYRITDTVSSFPCLDISWKNVENI